MTIFNLMKMEETCPKRVENNVGKGEIARNEQLLLFPTMFSKDLYFRHVKTGLVWEWVNKTETIYQLPLKTPHKKFAISFCLFNKGPYFSWYVVIIHQALLDIAADIRTTNQLK